MALTVSQQKAVDARNSNTLVFASAGGGKTKVLVTRLVNRIIEDRVSLNEIVAMTFTEAAAMEMKQRIAAALREKLEEDTTNEFILEQLSLLDDAKICTIDSYCLSLLKEYYYLLPIKKERLNNVLDNGKKELLLKEAFNNLLNTNDISLLIGQFTDGLYSLNGIKQVLDGVLYKASSHFSPLMWFDQMLDKEINSFDDLSSEIKYTYLNSIRVSLKTIESDIEYILSLEANQNFITILNKVKELEKYSGNYEKYIESIKQAFSVQTKCTNEIAKEYRTKTFKSNVEKLARNLIPERQLVVDFNNSIKVSNFLLTLTKKYYQEYQSIKERENVLDFSDFEHFAYDLLIKNDNALSKKLKKYYKEVLVDEFQDTNFTQYEIAKLISENNLFIVGDIKQSIYKFRNAEPRIMRTLMKDKSFNVIHIKENFRSNTNIIEFNNHLYQSIMNLTGDNYLDDDVQVRGSENQDKDNKPIVFYEVNKDINKYQFIASRIAELVQNEGLAFKDISVLVKTHAYKHLIIEALKQYNIPFFYSENESYLKSDSLDTLISYFKVLLDDNDLISRVTVLTSRMYKLSDNDLLKIKESNYRYPQFEEDINKAKEYLKNNELFKLISFLLSINNYYFDLPQADKVNVDLFIKNTETYKFNTLYDLLLYIEDTKNEKANSSSIISNDADVVKVMTIHASKGLEFNTVFVVSESRNINEGEKDKVIIDQELGLAVNSYYPEYKSEKTTVKRKAIIDKNNLEDIEEYERLFYVATTRAKNRLYIVDNQSDMPTSKNVSLIYSGKGFTSFIKAFPQGIETQYINELSSVLPFKKQKDSQDTIKVGNYNHAVIEEEKPSDHNETSLFFKDSVDYGTRVHEVFEKLDIVNGFDESLLNDFPYGKDKVKDAINAFLNSDIINEVKTCEIYKELEFYESKENKSIHGFIDFCAIKENEIILIDYKTNSNITKEELISLYQNQLNYYRGVLKHKENKPVKAYLYSTSLKEFIEI